MTDPSSPRRIAVLDVGKTNVKVVLFDGQTGDDLLTRTIPNTVLANGPYPHFDTTRIEAFFVDTLADLVARGGGFDALSITAHGGSGTLVAPDGRLAMPVLDYEFAGVDETAEAYDRVRPPFSETFSPRLLGGLNVGAQLFWQRERFPALFADASAFVTYPQFWALWLTGVPSTEPTSLGCHTDVWAPREGRFSSLVDAMGWRGLMAPVRSAFDVLGPVRAELSARIGLARPVPVTCGLHDSNASLLPHIPTDGSPLTVISTGTWAVFFALGGSLDRLDGARDMLANVDAYGRATPSARFMGGREFDILTGGHPAPVTQGDLEGVLERGIMALPTFSPGNGPFPHGTGRWSHEPAALSPGERTAAAGLYTALMTDTCLSALGAQGPTVLEGPFGRNPVVRDALAMLSKRPVVVTAGSTGTSAGAALLALPDRPAPPRDTPAPTFRFPPAFDRYAASWRAAATG